MVLSWTKGSRVFRRARKGKELLSSKSMNDLQVEIAIPTNFRCPITLDLMKDPVTLSTGITYDRDSIEKWIESGNNTCAVTKTKLTNLNNILVPNHSLRRMIQDWCVQHRSYGVERIPTPRIPVTPYEVTDTCSKILLTAQNGDMKSCIELVRKMKGWGKESERNKKCIVSKGSSIVLSNVFDSLSRGSVEKNVVVLEEVLEVLTWMRSVSDEGKFVFLGTSNSLSCLVWFLNDEQKISTRQNASLLIKEMNVESLVKIEGVFEYLVSMIKVNVGINGTNGIGNVSTKACLSTIFHMVYSSKNKKVIMERFVELGLVTILLEIIVDCEKGVCEKALGVLNCLCDSKEGVQIAKSNALTLPLVIKKLLRVSELSSSFVVSIVYKVCDKAEESVLIEAIQMGVFQKLLVLLQVGCVDSTKEKATELLKLLNGYKSKAECVDSSSLDYLHLKKPF